ncbi:MAG: flagellar hook-basal body complex protein [Clostridium sp.]
MLRSMYSGISGMKANQVKLDVIGNNIANVGTTAFKSSRVTFNDMLSQNAGDAQAPSVNMGGTNAMQVGLGVQLSSIDTVMTQGNMQPTGRSLDVAIDGEGFFMVSRGPVINGDGTLEVNHKNGNHSLTEQSLSSSGSELLYSRDGSFILDEQGNLLTSDGYRVMGYSLTNDDNGSSATAQKPNNVNVAGLDFRFGPGSQLNGYKVVLGQVGPQTPTSAKVDEAAKLIVVNGDFSTPGALTAKQVESAVAKALSGEGISQSITVTGKPMNIEGLGSDGVKGGADATAPGNISVGGFTFAFGEGSELNGFTFEIGEIGSGTSTNAIVNKDTKKVIINGDFITKGSLTGDALKEELNSKLAAEGIKQQVTNVTGSPVNLANIATSVGTGANFEEGKMEAQDGANITSFGGIDFTNLLEFKEEVGNGAVLNGYKIKWGDTNASKTAVKVDKDTKVIEIHAKLKDNPDTESLRDEIPGLFNKALNDAGIKGVEMKQLPTAPTVTDDLSNVKGYIQIKDGVNLEAPKPINLGGFTINLPKGTKFDNYKFEISDVQYSGGLDVKVEDGIIKIKGDFVTPNEVTAAKLEDAINAKLPTDMGKVTVTGTGKVYTGLSSTAIDGGDDLKAPGSVTANGMTFEMTAGGALNDYRIQIGQITAGTKAEAKIDEKNKTIIINADLVTPGVTSSINVQNALNKALQEAGINQGIKVSGAPVPISGTESEETFGGTPVQSLEQDGTVNYVDATGDLKSYDENLKTLKIPNKVKIPGTDQELRVKSYTIDGNGVIMGVLEDGRVAALGQIAMASFNNAEGLSKQGGNLYASTVNSGEPILKTGVGTLGDDNSKGYGANLQGMLEMSNVDLGEQFTDMIVTTRAFQAAGKMINTGDEILQDIINLKR